MDGKYEKARKRVKAKKEFYKHLTTYLVMMVFFFLLNAVTSFGDWWFYWPMLGWGIGLMFHYLDVFGLPGVQEMNEEWEEKAIQEEMKRLDKHPASTRPVVEDSLDEEPLELKELKKERKRKWDDQDLV